MIYWHIQMYQPYGTGKLQIDSSLTLKEREPVIGTGDWDNIQCHHFTGKRSDGLAINDIVLVREGTKIIALCQVLSDSFESALLQSKYHNIHYRKVKVLDLYVGDKRFPQSRSTLQRLVDDQTNSWKFISSYYQHVRSKFMISDCTKILNYKKQVILQGPPGTGKTRTAKLMAAELLGLSDTKDLKDNDQFKLVQFHPSYTYEDFVRGIVAKPNNDGGGVLYDAENKTLASFANLALENYRDSGKSVSTLKNELNFNEKLNAFKNDIIDSLAKGEYLDIPGTTAQIVDITETVIKYKHKNNMNYPYAYTLLFTDFIKLNELGREFKTSTDITKTEELLERKAAGTYYFHLYKLIISREESVADAATPDVKPYILVIDEINRANLSSVLGELIYALEYRGESVESMYDVGGRSLMLPPNLYIIGTMNTADRSVGHIDYAIRRRFAFIDVLPKNLTNELSSDFQIEQFKIVSELFVKNYDFNADLIDNSPVILERSDYMTGDFEPKDVWLGHSYFIQQYEKGWQGNLLKDQPIDFHLRVKYEIKPILLEYIKDGILKESARDIINKL